MADPLWVNGEFSDTILLLDDGLLQFQGLRVRLVNDDLWQDNLYVAPADVVVLCRGFLGKVEELVEAYPSSCLVLDASLYKHSRARIRKECAALGIDVVDISEMGAIMLLPADANFSLRPMRGK